VSDSDSLLDGTRVPRDARRVRSDVRQPFTGTTHHQGLALARRPGAAKPTHTELRPKDRPLTNDFVSDAEFKEMLSAWFGNASRVLLPGRSFYIWGGYSNFGNYPPALSEAGLYFSQAII
jgi:hypothetical protein